MAKLRTVLQRINILVADDMDIIRDMVGGCLREMGANGIAMAANGEIAWKLLNKAHFDLIICDWAMPQLSGLELLQRVRASAEHEHIPFLMLTASTAKDDVLAAAEAGVTDYLTKPFQARELEVRIIKMLGEVKLQPAQG